MSMRVCIETWGCQMNLHQSEVMAGVLTAAGYTMVDDLEHADVVIFNGCMVRQLAEEKVFGRIGAVADEKRKRPVLLGVGGCMGQIHGDALIRRVESIDFVFGSSGHQALPELIQQARSRRMADVAELGQEIQTTARRKSTVTGMVTIAQGCSNYCSYCIVPYARGPMRSRPHDLILAEVEELCQTGYKEVLLLGQNVNSYGTDDPTFGSFSELLADVAATGIPRVRFTTSHPKDITEAIYQAMAQSPNICHHLHLACQSGSDRVLRAMNRNYDRDHYISMIDLGRTIMPDLNVSTDLIVGFPGETDEDFEATMTLIERVRFGTVFVAKYSPRPKTRSASLQDDVPASVKEERLQRVLSKQRDIVLDENCRLIGQHVEVLVEGISRSGLMYGRADDHRTVMCLGEASVGEFVTVRIEGASVSSLSGGILRQEHLEGSHDRHSDPESGR